MENRKKNANLVFVFFIAIFAAVFVLSFSARSLINFSIHTMEDNIRQRLVSVSERLAELVAAEELNEYRTIEDMQKPSYQALRLKLRDFAERSDVEYVYYIRLESQQPHYSMEQSDVFRFIIDNDFNEETRVGLDTEVYEVFQYPWINEALNGKTVCSELGKYELDWDGLMTAYSPVFDAEGNVAAIAGADIYDKPIVNAHKMLSILTAAQIALLSMIFIAGLFLLRFYREAKNDGKMETQSRIKQRFLVFSTVFFLIILAGGSAVFIPAMRRMADANLEQSLNLAIQSMRLRIANEVNTEISLSVKMASAPIIRHYFLNPADPLLRDDAYEVIAAYRQSFKTDTVFWINDIDKIFYYDDGSHYLIDPDDPENYWYNLTLYETEKYNLNINYNTEMETISVFINAPVFDRGKAIGMVGTGIDLSDFISSIYRELDVGMELYVFNGFHEITVAQDRSLSLNKKSFSEHLGNLGEIIIETAKTLHSDTIKIFDVEDAKCAVSTLPLLGWYITAFTPVSAATFFDSVMTTIFLSMIGVVLAIFIISYGFISLVQAKVDKQTQRLVELKDAAEAADRSKTAFLMNTSHEIRTPMNAILGMAELILRKEVSPDVYEEAQNIKQAGKNLLAIINDILDFSKIESGKMDIIPAEYSLSSLINDVLSIIRLRITEKRLCFITRIDCSLPLVLIGDEARVRQVLLNLLSNAVKYTREGEISLCIRAAPNEGAGQEIHLIFEIIDTGVGIKPENLDRLFDEFVQFDFYNNQGVEGSGLGLPISRNLCRLMGGDISVESEFGKGSIFRVIVPQQVKDANPFVALRKTGGIALIAESRRNQAEALAYTTERLGVSCTLTETGEEMLTLLRANQYRFVIASARFYEQAKKTLEVLNSETLLAFLPEFDGDAVPQNERVLSLPVHPLILARFFNGETDSTTKAGEKLFQVKFTAPHARLLLVDDIATNLKVAEGLLAPYLAKIDTCLSGAEALKLVKEHSYDIIFMDHMMPEMDGIKATALIRAWEAEQGEGRKPLPIIALTANAILGMREMFLEKSFNDYLTKPIEIAKLEELMAKWIPKEKWEQGKPKPENRETGNGKEGEIFPAIAGVDIQAGLLMTGGTLMGYRQVLSMFRKDAQARLLLLQEIPKEDALPQFTTQVHALKSASASIGAAELSAQAARLEAAGKSGDLDLIYEALPGFTALLEAIVENIGAALGGGGLAKGESGDAGESGESGKAGARGALPPALLDRLEDALRSQKAGDIDRLLEELGLGAEGKIQGTLEQISDAVLMADFEQALEIVNSLRSEV